MYWILTLLCLCLSCSKEEELPSTTLFSGNAMTMDYRIIVGKKLCQKEVSWVQKAIRDVFTEVNTIYNDWNPNSEISHLNRLSRDVKIPLSSKLESFLLQIEKVVHLTEGRFDPTIAPLHHVWKEELSHGKIPSDEQLKGLATAVGWDKIHFEHGYIWKDHSLTSLDLGGIAKGYCIDLLTESLNSLGYPDVYVEWGGEIRASGEHPLHRPWRVFISRLGNPDEKSAIATVDLNNQAIATSGDYMQNWEVIDQGKKVTYFHIIHPQTLRPLVVTESSIASASVAAPSCLLADGLATAAMIFETSEEAKRWAESVQKKESGLQFWIVSR